MDPAALLVVMLFFAFAIMVLVALYKVFEKAGEPGWTAFCPIYNLFQIVKIAGLPAVSAVLFILPAVNYIFPVYVWYRVGRQFNRGVAFSLMNGVFPFFGLPYLAFSRQCTYGCQVSDAELIERGRRFDPGLPPAVPSGAAAAMPNIASAGWQQQSADDASDLPPVEAAWGGQPRAKQAPAEKPPTPEPASSGGVTFGVDL